MCNKLARCKIYVTVLTKIILTSYVTMKYSRQGSYDLCLVSKYFCKDKPFTVTLVTITVVHEVFCPHLKAPAKNYVL